MTVEAATVTAQPGRVESRPHVSTPFALRASGCGHLAEGG
jgi:hypothetical protein